jgi:beta-glucosidase
MVLLKNDNHLLPLKTDVHSIAVIGPLANDKIDLLGPVHALGRPDEAVTVLQGIKDEVSPNTTVRYAKGTDFDSLDTSGFAKAVSIARKSDVVVMVMGENAGMSGEGDSRSVLGLPGNQLDLVKKVMKTGKPVAVVLMNGRPLTIDWLHDNAPVILEAWFPGTEGGPAVADVLFGKYNPSGKLPMSFPRDVGQIPIYYNHLNTGRPYQPGNKYTSHYIDVPNTPLYPFGYGLSYTTFSYSQLHLNTQKLGWNDTLKVSIKVTNTGNRKGIDVVQLYIHDLVASVSLPVRELKGFRRVRLQPGESKEVTFRLSRDDLAFYRKDMTFGAEPGGFRVYVGDSSEAKQQATFTLVKSKQNRE